MKNRLILMALLVCHHAFAQVAPYTFRLGAWRANADATAISIQTPIPLRVRILPGGHTWPVLTLDEAGSVYVGDRVVAANESDKLSSSVSHPDERVVALPHGYRVTALANAYRISRGRNVCTLAPRELGLAGDKGPLEALKYGNVVFNASDRQLLALSTWLGAEKSDTTYSVIDIDLVHCRVHGTSLGNPDLLVELNRSAGGGWWVTGSIEQTLLRSENGRDWRPVALPEDLSSLVSAYIVDSSNIWLAGILPGSLDNDNDPLLIHSSDGGKSWKNISRADPVLKTLPIGWFEGWRRLGHPVGK
jgi:hypothetical protein